MLGKVGAHAWAVRVSQRAWCEAARATPVRLQSRRHSPTAAATATVGCLQALTPGASPLATPIPPTQHCGRPCEVTAIHAGLECGVLGAVLGGDVDMVSYGPTILGAHSPGGWLRAGGGAWVGRAAALAGALPKDFTTGRADPRRSPPHPCCRCTMRPVPPPLTPASPPCAPCRPAAERLEVATVQPFWDATLEMLAELAQRR